MGDTARGWCSRDRVVLTFAATCLSLPSLLLLMQENAQQLSGATMDARDLPNDLLRRSSYVEAGVELRRGVCSKGEAPWNRTELMAELPRFLQAYNRRPDENRLGTPIMHQFAVWCIIRTLKPRHIIESGVLRGLGTWILRQAAPDAQLILLDPRTKLDLAYVDQNNDTLYFIGDKFRDFSTLSQWHDVRLDAERTLAFIDDHHTPFVRIAHARRANIGHMIFEDNYWRGFADCLSLKQGCACLLGQEECSDFKYRNAWGRTSREFRQEDFDTISETFRNLSVYAEFPMIWNLGENRPISVAENSSNFLYSDTDGKSLLLEHGLKTLPPPSHIGGSYTYFNIAYIKLIPYR